jgi:t-SNARE complex subunit (syntaxin)
MKALDMKGGNGMNNHETRIILLEKTCIDIGETLKRLEIKMDHGFDKIDKRISDLDKKMDAGFERLDKKIDSGFERMNSRVWSIFYWGIAAFVGMLTLIAHAMEWI